MSPATTYISAKCVSANVCIYSMNVFERGGLCFFVHVCVSAAVCLS